MTPALRLALAGGALILLLQSVPAIQPLLEYRRALLLAEPWRLFTGHFIHINWTHALINAAAWPVLALLFAPQLGARRQWLCVTAGALAVSAALAVVYPQIAWYRGASGVLHALYFAGAAALATEALRQGRWPLVGATALFAAGAIKVALELPHAADTPYAQWLGATTVPQAHLFGAIAGTAFGLLPRRRRDRAVRP